MNSLKPRILRYLIIAALLVVPGGCVSTTLDSSQFEDESSRQTETANTTTQTSEEALQADAEPLALSGQDSQADASDGSTAPSEDGSVLDPDARARAVSEMRAKAANSSGEKTQFGAVPETATEAMTAQEQAELGRELSETASTDVVSDEELAAKQRSINEMKRKAKRHYKDALTRIEKR